MSCETRASLTEAWDLGRKLFSVAVEAMTEGQIPRMPDEDFLVLLTRTDEAWLASENARILLELHRKKHGC